MGLHAHVGRGPGRVGGEQLRHIGFRAAVAAGLVKPCGFVHHQLGAAHLRIGARDRELHALILPDRPSEHIALLGVAARPPDEPFGVADAFGRDQDALGVHAGQDVTEALPFAADQILGRHAQVVEEYFGGGMVHHGADRPDGEALAPGLAHVDQEHREPFGAFLRLLPRRGAGEQQHQVGMLDPRRPDFLAVDDVMVVIADRGGA